MRVCTFKRKLPSAKITWGYAIHAGQDANGKRQRIFKSGFIRRFAAFLSYVDDWLSSPRVALMTCAEQGAYTNLLARAWQAPDCGLPDDDEALAKLSGLGRKWKSSAKKIRANFVSRNHRLYNERLLEERQNQEKIRATRSAAGSLVQMLDGSQCNTCAYGRYLAARRRP